MDDYDARRVLEEAVEISDALSDLINGLKQSIGDPEARIVVLGPRGLKGVPISVVSEATGFRPSVISRRAQMIPGAQELQLYYEIDLWTPEHGHHVVPCVTEPALPSLILNLPLGSLRKSEKKAKLRALRLLAERVEDILTRHIEEED